jgi:hypothetical protein
VSAVFRLGSRFTGAPPLSADYRYPVAQFPGNVARKNRGEAMANDDTQTMQRQNRRVQSTDSLGPLIPIILVATLIFVITDRHRSNAERQAVTTESTFDDSAFLGGVVRKYSSANFRKGQAEAIMGGIDLDFRDATIEGDEARLDVTAIMGGVKIRVPRTWIVVNRVTPILGGVDDNTDSVDGNKRLVIEGTVLMGGLDIKN